MEVKARARYSGLLKSLISSESRLPSKRDTTATGPMAISLELPMKAYTRGATKLVSAKPTHRQY